MEAHCGHVLNIKKKNRRKSLVFKNRRVFLLCFCIVEILGRPVLMVCAGCASVYEFSTKIKAFIHLLRKNIKCLLTSYVVSSKCRKFNLTQNNDSKTMFFSQNMHLSLPVRSLSSLHAATTWCNFTFNMSPSIHLNRLLFFFPPDVALREPRERERPRGDGQVSELRHHHSGQREAAGRRVQGQPLLAEAQGFRYGPG